MNEIQLLYVENTISRKRGVAQQALTFCFYVRNLAYDKQVEVHWAGEDGAWQTLPAAYWAPSGSGGEIWLARTWRQSSPTASLPGNVEFVAAYRTGGAEYWCKPTSGGGYANARAHFTCQADAGLHLGEGIDFLHVGHQPRLQVDQKMLTVDVAISPAVAPWEVFVEWSVDGWRTRQRTPCFYARDYWDKSQQSVARNPNQYGVQVWTARLRIRDAYRVEYAAGCVTASGERWDNNRGHNYIARHADLKVLTLNLHTYQEDNQGYKFSQVARAINELGIDLICLQEVGENWNNGQGDWNSNAAKIICERLDHKYHLHADWAHIGFDRYREGIAILSRFPFRRTDGRYVSTTQDVYSIHARKAVLGQVEVPYLGLVNVFSTHLSWWQDGFAQQFDALAAWANASHVADVAATIICGDFNVKAGAEGYAHVIHTSDYEDQFLKRTDRKIFDRVFRKRSSRWADGLRDDGRIDYIWAKRGSCLKPTAARRLFLDHDYGRVSDHEGFMVTFEVP